MLTKSNSTATFAYFQASKFLEAALEKTVLTTLAQSLKSPMSPRLRLQPECVSQVGPNRATRLLGDREPGKMAAATSSINRVIHHGTPKRV
jgi:hypothetical protein